MPTYSVSNVNIGTTANDGSGDPIRSAFLKINQNLRSFLLNESHLNDCNVDVDFVNN